MSFPWDDMIGNYRGAGAGGQRDVVRIARGVTPSTSGHRLVAPAALVGAEEGEAGVGVERPREPVPLDFVATLAAQVVQLLGGLDAFGDDVEAERMRQRDDRRGDRRVLRV